MEKYKSLNTQQYELDFVWNKIRNFKFKNIVNINFIEIIDFNTGYINICGENNISLKIKPGIYCIYLVDNNLLLCHIENNNVTKDIIDWYFEQTDNYIVTQTSGIHIIKQNFMSIYKYHYRTPMETRLKYEQICTFKKPDLVSKANKNTNTLMKHPDFNIFKDDEILGLNYRALSQTSLYFKPPNSCLPILLSGDDTLLILNTVITKEIYTSRS
jgi:hypothetical protein